MIREVELNGQQVKLYKVRGYENAWCSDPRLTHQIERKRREIFRELRLTTKQIKTIADGRF